VDFKICFPSCTLPFASNTLLISHMPMDAAVSEPLSQLSEVLRVLSMWKGDVSWQGCFSVHFTHRCPIAAQANPALCLIQGHIQPVLSRSGFVSATLPSPNILTFALFSPTMSV